MARGRGIIENGVFKACRDTLPRCAGRAEYGRKGCSCDGFSASDRNAAARHGLSATSASQLQGLIASAERRGARPVYYMPEPFRPERRIEVALIKRAVSGAYYVLRPERPWWEQETNAHVLRPEDRAVIRLGIEDLRTWARGDALPVSMGPHFVLGEPC